VVFGDLNKDKSLHNTLLQSCIHREGHDLAWYGRNSTPAIFNLLWLHVPLITFRKNLIPVVLNSFVRVY